MANRPLNKVKILVVDDEVLIREGLTYMLEESGADVVCAENGEEALYHLRKSQFDVVISDYRMAYADGIKLLEGIHKEIRPMPKLFMCTGNVDAVKARAAQLNVIEVFEKPFAFSYIIRKIAA